MSKKLRYILSILIIGILGCEIPGLERNLNSGSSTLPSIPVEEPAGDEGDKEPGPNPPQAIEDKYPFLKNNNFWNEMEKIIPIPSSKSCRNRNSYAYFGIVRLVSQLIEGYQFSMFPFDSELRYYRFLNKVEPEEPKKWEIFGQDSLYPKLLELNKEVSSVLGKNLTLTGITKHHDFKHDLHCRHRGGNVFDMRPFPGTQPVTWRSSFYDREANRFFIKKLLTWDKVELIFFNDPEILNDPEVKTLVNERSTSDRPVRFQSASGHDNHLHIEFYIEGELERVSTYVYNKLGLNKLSIMSSDEYMYH